jgi:hypothetical protein
MEACTSRLLLVALLVVAVSTAGCRQATKGDTAADIQLSFSVEPDPPKVGNVMATLRLIDKNGRPVRATTVKLEGNMNHAGMKPSFAEAKEIEPGRYDAKLDLTMGGDWFVLVDATLADGRKLSRKIDLPGVKSR